MLESPLIRPAISLGGCFARGTLNSHDIIMLFLENEVTLKIRDQFHKNKATGGRSTQIGGKLQVARMPKGEFPTNHQPGFPTNWKDSQQFQKRKTYHFQVTFMNYSNE